MSEIVEKAKAALEGVTEGPWVVNREGWAVISSGSDSVFHGYTDTECETCGDRVEGTAKVAISVEDAEFIAAARTLVPELVSEVERLRMELALSRGGVEVRPLTEVESNLMTQVLDLRRQLAEFWRSASNQKGKNQ